MGLSCLFNLFGTTELGGSTLFSLVLSREWGNGFLGLLRETLRDCHRDPFHHSLLRTREFFGCGSWGLD